jgi:thiol-disulfide isomerase/thioredoxin
MSATRRRLATIAWALALAAGCQRAPSSASTAKVDNRGEEIAEKMLAAYRQAPSYSDRAVYVQQATLRSDGVERLQPFFHMSLAFERPNRLRLKFQEAVEDSASRQGFDIASNGAVLRASTGVLAGQVQESAAPAELTVENFIADPLIREVFQDRRLGDVFPQLAMLLNKDDSSLVFPDDESPRLLDSQSIGGRSCFRVATTSPQGARILWIDAQNFVLRRMELPIDSERKALDPDDRYLKIAIRIDFEDAALGGAIDPQEFAMDVPAGDRRVRRFVTPPAPLADLGKPLGDYQFDTLDGKQVTPAALAGKTALLDFWQIDCAPCRAHTPRLEEVYRQLRDDPRFVFYAVNIDGPAAPNAVVEKTFRSWGGTMPILRDPHRSTTEKLHIDGTPTLALVDAGGRLQYFHIREHRDPEGLAKTIRLVIDGADLAADFQKELDSVTIADSILEVEVAQPEIATRKLPQTLAAVQRWQTKAEDLAAPGAVIAVNDLRADGKPSGLRVFALDGATAVVEFDAEGGRVARRELPAQGAAAAAGAAARERPAIAAQPGTGLLRTAVDSAGRRLFAASGVGWQKLHVIDDGGKTELTFPRDRHPGIADVRFIAGAGEPQLCVGYWGGVGMQGVGLDGRRKWSERSLDQVVQLAVVPSAEDPASSEIWCTSSRGDVYVLDSHGKPLREIAVGLRAIMHVAVADVDGARYCCGLAVERVGRYRVVGFAPDGKIAWQHALPEGEYTRQVERIQHVRLPGGTPAWVIAAADGTILWFDHAGKLVDRFAYGEPLCGLSLTNLDDAAILLVSTPANLTAWKLEAPAAPSAESAN